MPSSTEPDGTVSRVTISGLLLTGGTSRRLGFGKHDVHVHGERLADRTARVLLSVCDPVLEIGPGVTGLAAIQEETPGSGPLAALQAGADALRARGHVDAVLVLAVDLPFVEEPLLSWLARHQAPGSVVPRVDGIAQPLCARYSPSALVATGALVAAGARSMHALLDDIDVTYVEKGEWGTVCDARAFVDIDTPDDLAAQAGFGVSYPP